MKLYFRYRNEETIVDYFRKGGFFLCTRAWPQYACWQFFPHGYERRVPRNAVLFYRGLRGANGEVVYSSLYEKTVENHFYKGGVFLVRMGTVCRFAIFSSWILGRGFKERTKNLQGLRGPEGEVVFSSLYEKTVENHFYKGLFFFVHWRMATVSRFAIFPHGSGGGIPRNAEKICRGLRSPNGEVVFSSLYFRWSLL